MGDLRYPGALLRIYFDENMELQVTYSKKPQAAKSGSPSRFPSSHGHSLACGLDEIDYRYLTLGSDSEADYESQRQM